MSNVQLPVYCSTCRVFPGFPDFYKYYSIGSGNYFILLQQIGHWTIGHVQFIKRTTPSLPSMDHCYEPISWKNATQYKRETARIRQEYYDNNARSLSQLLPGQKVVLQNPLSKRWTSFGEILKIQDTKRSYLVLCDDGKVLDRNRRLIRPVDLS